MKRPLRGKHKNNGHSMGFETQLLQRAKRATASAGHRKSPPKPVSTSSDSSPAISPIQQTERREYSREHKNNNDGERGSASELRNSPSSKGASPIESKTGGRSDDRPGSSRDLISQVSSSMHIVWPERCSLLHSLRSVCGLQNWIFVCAHSSSFVSRPVSHIVLQVVVGQYRGFPSAIVENLCQPEKEHAPTQPKQTMEPRRIGHLVPLPTETVDHRAWLSMCPTRMTSSSKITSPHQVHRYVGIMRSRCMDHCELNCCVCVMTTAKGGFEPLPNTVPWAPRK